jgi:hypothetical protein
MNIDTADGASPYTLVMQDDCNLVVYNKNNQAKWATGTNQVASGPPVDKLYSNFNGGQWVGGNGLPGIVAPAGDVKCGAWVESNGNFVVGYYGRTRKIMFESKTAGQGSGPFTMNMMSNGVFEIHDSMSKGELRLSTSCENIQSH